MPRTPLAFAKVVQWSRTVASGTCRRGSSAVLNLVAAEEARSGAGGQHPEVPPRADAARAQPGPAPFGRQVGCEDSVLVHANPAYRQDTTPNADPRTASC